MSKFVHLHTHSHYSLLSALPKIPELVDEAIKHGMPALALTDSGNLYGALEFYKECTKKGIKPIIGLDAYMAARARTDKQAGIDNKRNRIVLLAKDMSGYKNLIALVTASNFEGFYYRPRIDKELLERHNDGLIAISPLANGDIGGALRSGNEEKAREYATWWRTTFGNDFYLELTHHPEMERAHTVEQALITFARNEKIPLVAAHDIYYINPNDAAARTTLLSVQTSADYTEPGSSDDDIDLSFLPPEEMERRFSNTPDALENASKIADSCAISLTLGKWIFPEVKTQPGKTHDEELREKVYAGITKRGIHKTDEVVTRIEYELGIIKQKGYSPYFLVVSDLLDYAHQHHILTTIRGSVAGSLVTYLAGITNVNPLEYKLPFERFLNPDRPTAPDIDMDFADNRRDEMIEYAKRTYGADRVAQIGTFGTMMARGSVRDVARALGFDYTEGDRIAKLIPMGSQGFPMTIDHALELVPELQTLYKKDSNAKRIIDMAKKIEGCVRHISVHAAGVVIAPSKLTDYTPLQFDPKGEGKIITQYDMYSIADEYGGVGLLKFDFLGIKNLAILADAVRLTETLEGVRIDIENIPVDDKKTFEMLARGETGGLFQLNGTGMTKYLMDLRPSTIHDINAMVALYRPGPMESIPKYIERKQNPKLVTYLDPRMKDILERSYGVITYQDDVMLIAIHIAGFSWVEADKLRKAMGKKIPAEMEAQKEKLLSGFKKNGLTDNKAEALWKLIEPFAAYGFNKAHAASYGRVAYQTAYMKANYPAIYMASVLTADSGDIEKIGEIVAECRRMGISVLPPDVNESFEGFTVVKKEQGIEDIRFGLTTIKNFGEGVGTSIITERKQGGKFISLANFLGRIKDKNLNKKSLEALIKAGALDAFGERGILMANIERLLEYSRERGKESADQSSLFSGFGPSYTERLDLTQAPAASEHERLTWEKEFLGLYLSGHPLEKFRDLFEKRDVNIKRVTEEYKEGMNVVIGGIIEETKEIIAKGNQPMLFLRIADFTGSIEAVVFPKTYAELRNTLLLDACVALKGRVSNRNNAKSLIVEAAKPLSK